jgi:two-component system, OmpR family, alkaline phosphatase synthesis response regulator PhoP
MKKILIVEDDKFLNNAYKIKFTKAGYEVKVATDGNEALKVMSEFTPDIILLDLMMPIKDGFATLEEIRANPNWKNIPVIIASNLGQQEDIQRGIGLGATDFIIKSDMSMESLMAKVTQLLEKTAPKEGENTKEVAVQAPVAPAPTAPADKQTAAEPPAPTPTPPPAEAAKQAA